MVELTDAQTNVLNIILTKIRAGTGASVDPAVKDKLGEMLEETPSRGYTQAREALTFLNEVNEYLTTTYSTLDILVEADDVILPGEAVTPTATYLQRSSLGNADILPMQIWINAATDAIGFNTYVDYVDRVLCQKEEDDEDDVKSKQQAASRKTPTTYPKHRKKPGRKHDCLQGTDAYQLLKTTTQSFLLMNCRTPASDQLLDPDTQTEYDSDAAIPESMVRVVDQAWTWGELQQALQAYLGEHENNYLTTVLRGLYGGEVPDDALVDSPFCKGIVKADFGCPCLLELIWNYWHEESMLSQSMNAVSLRFQNIRMPGKGKDPLAELEVDPLRPLNNLLWGYVQDEMHRLTVQRRNYEFNHQYGLRLIGRAVKDFHPADPRSKFVEAFHHLLFKAARFIQEDSDTTVVADGYPVLNALKEVHLLLAQAAHNQFGDLTWQSRAEMLMQMWILARPETREFLGTRVMVPYEEPWMGRVDAMKRLQGWTSTSVTHFHKLAVFGEKLLLSVRYGNWNSIDDQEDARVWVRYWRPQIQGYIHAYRSATGVDLETDNPDAETLRRRNLVPAVHLQRQLSAERTG